MPRIAPPETQANTIRDIARALTAQVSRSTGMTRTADGLLADHRVYSRSRCSSYVAAESLLVPALQFGSVSRRLEAGQQFDVAGIEGSGFLRAGRSVGGPKLGPLRFKAAACALFIAHAGFERIRSVGCGGATRGRHVERGHAIRDANDELRAEQSGKERRRHDVPPLLPPFEPRDV